MEEVILGWGAFVGLMALLLIVPVDAFAPGPFCNSAGPGGTGGWCTFYEVCQSGECVCPDPYQVIDGWCQPVTPTL